MTFSIKNMVSLRCKLVVAEELMKLGIAYTAIDLGFAEISREITYDQRELFRVNLLMSGLELLDDKKSILVEKIKNLVTIMIHYSDALPEMKLSEYISKEIGYNYTYLANIFSEAKHVSIRQYIINHKIERIKELLLYDELNLTEISCKMHYSSVGHLSNQFKKQTHFSPSAYKQQHQVRTVLLENV